MLSVWVGKAVACIALFLYIWMQNWSETTTDNNREVYCGILGMHKFY